MWFLENGWCGLFRLRHPADGPNQKISFYADKKIINQPKRFIQPTDTRLSLWYDVFFFPILMKCYSFKTRVANIVYATWIAIPFSESNLSFFGLHLILRVFQDLSGVHKHLSLDGWYSITSLPWQSTSMQRHILKKLSINILKMTRSFHYQIFLTLFWHGNFILYILDRWEKKYLW